MTMRRALSGIILAVLMAGMAACGSDPGSRPKMQIGGKATGTSAAQQTPSNPSQAKNAFPPGKAAPDTAKEPAQPNPEAQKPKFDPSRVTKSNFDRIDLNMSVDEVCEILGPPSAEKTLDADSRELHWQTGVRSITALFRNGKLKIIDSRNLDSK
jgi:hypothetical protein